MDAIVSLLEAQEPGNDGLSSKYCPYVKKLGNINKLQDFILVPGVFRARLEGLQRNRKHFLGRQIVGGTRRTWTAGTEPDPAPREKRERRAGSFVGSQKPST